MLFLILACIFTAMASIDTKVIKILADSGGGGGGPIKLPLNVPIAFGFLSSKYPEFDFVLKRVLSEKSLVDVPAESFHLILKLEVTSKDHADQVENCELDYVEDLQTVITKVEMRCEHESKTYMYA